MAGVGVLMLILAVTFVIVYNERTYREAIVQQVEAQAQILASTVKAPLAFDDQPAAREYVNALGADPRITSAGVYGPDRKLFAGYSRTSLQDVPTNIGEAGTRIQGDQLVVTSGILDGGADVGWVRVTSSLEPIGRRLERYSVIALLALMAGSIFIILGMAQRRLSAANRQLVQQSSALAAANRDLRAQIERRETAETALRQAQKMEAIGQLTGGIAHDFNNLLQVIVGNLEALKRRAVVPDADAQKMIDAAIRSAERAATLTARLLAFSRRQPLDPKPIDVNKLVAAMSELLHRTLGESMRIETVLASGIWRVRVDANQLENALLNLAVNSRDAMPNGGSLTIETGNAHLDEAYASAHGIEPGQYVALAVTDTGTGMSDEVVRRAFEPFFTTKDIGRGSGLGLSQVYGFIRQSGGHVKIYSEPGQGTTVKLYLPRLIGAEDEVAGETKPAETPVGHRDQLILVVEDEEDVRQHAVGMLRELGYSVLEARDGRSALNILAANTRVKLLFTDVGLPNGMNGRELAAQARLLYPSLPVLFTTGYARNAIIHHGRLDPGVELITKPFNYSALATKIQQVLRTAAAQTAATNADSRLVASAQIQSKS